MQNNELEALLRAKFLEEGGRLLEKTGASLAAINLQSASAADLDQIYRLAHNFKAGAKTVGFQEIGDFATAFEGLANQVRRKEIELTPPVVDVLVRCFRTLESALKGLGADPNYGLKPAVTIAEIEACLRKS